MSSIRGKEREKVGERWGKEGKSGKRLQLPYIKPYFPRRPMPAGGKRERTSLTHKVRQSQLISTRTLSVIGPPEGVTTVQSSLVLAVLVVTA